MPTGSPIDQQLSPSSSGSDVPLSRTNLYLRGLSPQTTDKDLLNMCNGMVKFGKIVSTKAILDPATSKCKGYGFVDFENEQAAQYTLKQLQLKGVQAQMAKQQEQDPTNLYISNLPSFIAESDLEQMFKQYGTVVSTRILRDQNGVSKGVGFSRMESKEVCDKIIKAFNNQALAGSKEPLLVKLADGGNKKRTQSSARDVMNINGLPIAYDAAAAAAALQRGLYLPAYTPAAAAAQPSLVQGLLPRHYAATAAATGLPNPAALYGAQPSSATWFPAASAAGQPFVMQSAAAGLHSHMLPAIHTADGAHLQQLVQPALAQQLAAAGHYQLAGLSMPEEHI